jgi:predicted NUDIX family phosphoesterase
MKPAVLVVPSPAPTSTEELLASREHFFMERMKAESDLSVKQIIPYIVIVKDDSVLAYKRSSGTTESRLHGMLSIGWGGHIEEIDSEPDVDTDLATYIRNCALREIQEELSWGAPVRCTQLGLVNDDETEVGRFHLGWLEAWEYSGATLVAAEDTAEETFWLPLAQAESLVDNLESWSQLALKQLAGIRSDASLASTY